MPHNDEPLFEHSPMSILTATIAIIFALDVGHEAYKKHKRKSEPDQRAARLKSLAEYHRQGLEECRLWTVL